MSYKKNTQVEVLPVVDLCKKSAKWHFFVGGASPVYPAILGSKRTYVQKRADFYFVLVFSNLSEFITYQVPGNIWFLRYNIQTEMIAAAAYLVGSDSLLAAHVCYVHSFVFSRISLWRSVPYPVHARTTSWSTKQRSRQSYRIMRTAVNPVFRLLRVQRSSELSPGLNQGGAKDVSHLLPYLSILSRV